MGDTFVAIVETLRHEDETKSKKLHAFECKVSSRPLGSELNQLVETGDGHRGIKWPRSRLPHLQRQRREYQTTRSVVPLQKLIDFDNGARALHTPEANKEIGKAKRSSSRTRVRSDPNSDTKDPDEYLRLLFWNNGEGKTKAPRIHRLLTKASVKEKLRKLETHNALNPGSVDAYLDRAFEVVGMACPMHRDCIGEDMFLQIIKTMRIWEDESREKRLEKKPAIKAKKNTYIDLSLRPGARPEDPPRPATSDTWKKLEETLQGSSNQSTLSWARNGNAGRQAPSVKFGVNVKRAVSSKGGGPDWQCRRIGASSRGALLALGETPCDSEPWTERAGDKHARAKDVLGEDDGGRVSTQKSIRSILEQYSCSPADVQDAKTKSTRNNPPTCLSSLVTPALSHAVAGRPVMRWSSTLGVT